MLRITWMGMGGNRYLAEQLADVIKEAGMKLVIISEWGPNPKLPDIEYIKWDEKTWLEELKKCDIAIAPSNVEQQPAKSNVKVTTYMAAGLPVIAAPLRSYEEVLDKGSGFMIADNSDWRSCLEKLKDENVRKKMVEENSEVLKEYSLHAISTQWKDLIERKEEPKKEEKPVEQPIKETQGEPVSIDFIIPTYGLDEYTKICLQSIHDTVKVPWGAIIIRNDPKDNPSLELSKYMVIDNEVPKSFAASVNQGLKEVKSKYVCIMNNDVVLTPHAMENMVKELEAYPTGNACANPFSNCDLGFRHNEKMWVGGKELHPDMVIGDVTIEGLYDYGRNRNSVAIEPICVDWLAFYCTLIPRKLFDTVGILDEELSLTYNDKEWCERATKKMGTDAPRVSVLMHVMNAFVFHYGAKTRKRVEKEDSVKYHKTDEDCKAVYEKKKENKERVRIVDQIEIDSISLIPKAQMVNPHCTLEVVKEERKKLKIAFYSGPSWENWFPDSIVDTGIGGSETCQVYMAKELAFLGHDVWSFSQCKGYEGDWSGVHYVDFEKYNEHKQDWDVAINVRQPEAIEFFKGKYNILWTHDVHYDNPGDFRRLIPGREQRLDRHYLLSPWHVQHMKDIYGLKDERIFQTRDGVDLKYLRRHSTSAPDPINRRIPGRLIWASSYDRGLDILVQMLPKIKEKVPELSLFVYYGDTTLIQTYKQYNNEGMKQWHNKLMKDIDLLDYVTVCGRVGLRDLTYAFQEAMLLLYPSYTGWGPFAFHETFCMNALLAMAAGTPIACAAWGALETTVGERGILIGGDPTLPNVQEFYINIAAELLTDQEKWKQFENKGLAFAKNHSWEIIAKEWEEDFYAHV